MDGPPNMTVFIDPDVTAPLLRQGIYDGDVIILTNLTSVRDFVDSRGSSSPSSSGLMTRSTPTSTSTRFRWHNCSARGNLGSSTPQVEGTGPQSDPRDGLQRSGDPLRCPEASHILSRGPLDHRYRLHLPVAPGRLVQRTSTTNQLVATRTQRP